MREQLIIPPTGGWKENTWYLIDIAYRPGNPIHRSLLFTGFLNEGRPGNYSFIQAIAYNETHRISDPMYIKALKVVVTKAMKNHPGKAIFAPNDKQRR